MEMGTPRRLAVLLAASGAAVAAALPAIAANPGNPTKGKVLFKKTCGSCHALKAAGTTGPLQNLDRSKPTYAKAILITTNGSKKNPVMIAYKTTLTKAQIQDLAAFIDKST
jgi:mono/diheme cytochrome c family protein